MNDAPIKNCPKCGQEVRRLIFGGAGVIFKGSGFYVTDKGKNTTGTGVKPSADKKSAKSENSLKSEASQSAPAEASASANASPCSECPKKGAGASCPA